MGQRYTEHKARTISVNNVRMAKIWLNQRQKEQVIEHMNPKGHNHKDVNFFNVLEKLDDGYYRIEVGYWITYLNCRPKYEKQTITIKLND